MDGRFISYEVPFDPRNLRNLARIVHSTGAKIVLTSTWRNEFKCEVVLKARLKEYGMEIFDMLQLNTNSHERGHVIKDWLMNHGELESITLYADNEEHVKIHRLDHKFLIIDDYKYDILQHFTEKKLIKVNPRKGLTYLDSMKAIYRLKSEDD